MEPITQNQDQIIWRIIYIMVKKKQKSIKEKTGNENSSQHIIHNRRSIQIKKIDKTTSPQIPLLNSILSLMPKAQSTLFHSQIIYWYTGTSLQFYAVTNSTGTIDITYSTAWKSGLSLMINTSIIQLPSSIGAVTSQNLISSPYLDYYYIYLSQQPSSSQCVFLGLGSQFGIAPTGWNFRIAHDDFASAFLTADTALSRLSPVTQNLSFSPSIGTITNFLLQSVVDGKVSIKEFSGKK